MESMSLRSAYRYLHPYVWRYRRAFLAGMLCLMLKDAIAVCGPFVLGSGIDALKAGRGASAVGGFALLLVAISIVRGLFQYWMRVILIGISRDIEYDLRNDLFRHLIGLSPDYYARHPHRRHHGARHQRPERRPHDARARHHVLDRNQPHVRAGDRDHGCASTGGWRCSPSCPRRWSASR